MSCGYRKEPPCLVPSNTTATVSDDLISMPSTRMNRDSPELRPASMLALGVSGFFSNTRPQAVVQAFPAPLTSSLVWDGELGPDNVRPSRSRLCRSRASFASCFARASIDSSGSTSRSTDPRGTRGFRAIFVSTVPPSAPIRSMSARRNLGYLPPTSTGLSLPEHFQARSVAGRIFNSRAPFVIGSDFVLRVVREECDVGDGSGVFQDADVARKRIHHLILAIYVVVENQRCRAVRSQRLDRLAQDRLSSLLPDGRIVEHVHAGDADGREPSHPHRQGLLLTLRNEQRSRAVLDGLAEDRRVVVLGSGSRWRVVLGFTAVRPDARLVPPDTRIPRAQNEHHPAVREALRPQG